MSYVPPPMAEPDNGSITGAKLNNLCYQYTYDERNRLATKKIPGWDVQYLVYNKLDQAVATQSKNQRAHNQWLITKYDALGSVIMTGIWTNGNTATSPSALKTPVYGQSQQWENKDATQTFGYTQSYTLSKLFFSTF